MQKKKIEWLEKKNAYEYTEYQRNQGLIFSTFRRVEV